MWAAYGRHYGFSVSCIAPLRRAGNRRTETPGDGTIRLDDTDVSDLGAEDFLFREPPADPRADGG